MSDTAESDVPNPGAGEVIKLHPDADIFITVYEVSQKTSATFHVVRELLRSQSEKFKVLLDPDTPFNEGQKQTWTLKEDTGATTRTLELLFRCMLAGKCDTKTELPQSMYKLPVIEVWRVLSLVDIKAQDCIMAGKYLVSSDVIKGWFLGWFEKQRPNLKGQREFEQLLFPTTGQLEECCPFIAEDTGSRGYYHHMHMPKRVIAQLRKSRAGTRTHLENGIYKWTVGVALLNINGAQPLGRRPPSPFRYPFADVSDISTSFIRSDRLCLRLRSSPDLPSTRTKRYWTSTSTIPTTDTCNPLRPNSPTQSEALYEADASDVTESFPTSLHDNAAWSADGPWPRLPFMDFMGQDAFQMALDNPAISRQLSEYCEDQGCEEDVEFLMKVEYNEVTDDLAATISTIFTSAAAKNPLNPPPTPSGQLNADIRRIAHSILPRMESVFYDAARHVRRRIARDAFLGFVQRQFAHRTALALSSGTWAIGSSKLEYPGLGESFCNSAALSPEFATAATSDAFVAITGYPPSEIMPRIAVVCRARLPTRLPSVGSRGGLQEAREVTELILSYRRDREPFWNLSSLFPLKDHQGQLLCWLWAQIDVSESVRSRRDLLRALNRGLNPDVPTEADSLGESVASSAKTSLWTQHPAVKRRTLPRAGFPLNPPVYSHYFVLACEQFAPSSIIERQPTPTPTAGTWRRRRQGLKLKIAFNSEAAAELLSIRGDAAGLRIFKFLEQRGRSPSITKSLKSLVGERIEFGKPVGVEILVDPGRGGLFGSRKQNRHAGNRPGTSADADHVRSGPAEKLEKKMTRVSKQEKLMTHWTPLKDIKGDVEWIVLILAPRMTT
ncbi:hypothetical protein DL769_009382 [Monosporascus sp. CRB-8-3]|nr:hypothetical protein DL769_009382 [Monosporascus sp. CRB-8-3]